MNSELLQVTRFLFLVFFKTLRPRCAPDSQIRPKESKTILKQFLFYLSHFPSVALARVVVTLVWAPVSAVELSHLLVRAGAVGCRACTHLAVCWWSHITLCCVPESHQQKHWGMLCVCGWHWRWNPGSYLRGRCSVPPSQPPDPPKTAPSFKVSHRWTCVIENSITGLCEHYFLQKTHFEL